MTPIRAPFPWFGGKSRVADLVWQRFGDVPNYVEPFAGSLAVLLGRPHDARIETVNDKDAYLANFWRALKNDPEAVAHWADWPVNEADLHARHKWLVDQKEFRETMMTDPDFYDTRVAGWWVWGISQWIGSGWCSEPGWTGRYASATGRGIHKESPTKKLPTRKLPALDRSNGRSANKTDVLVAWMQQLADRLRRVRVCCGEWDRVLGPSPTIHIGVTAVLLDPPYEPTELARSNGGRGDNRGNVVYSHHDGGLSASVREWAIANGEHPKMRIALCGYAGEHKMPKSWTEVRWKAAGGYAKTAKGKENASRERIWFSPHCLGGKQRTMF